jgi:predicted butyrate kinase (DUF1464 family)
VIHLPTVPRHRKLQRIDLGTPDKLCVASLALAQGHRSACVVELGSVFTACVVLDAGAIVDGCGGTGGPVGWQSAGAWDGESAYLLSPLTKQDLFQGGAASAPDSQMAWLLLRESVGKTVAGLVTVTPVEAILMSGRLLEMHPEETGLLREELAQLAPCDTLPSLEGAWVKHAAQGAAVLADGLAGGTFQPVVASLRLREASGTVLDHLSTPRANEVRRAFFT